MQQLNNSLRSAMSALPVGKSLCVSLDVYKYGSLRNYVSERGVALDRVFSGRLNRKERTYTITRHE